MSNTLLTIDKITAECQRIAHEEATFIKTTNLQFDDSWSEEGPTGSTLRIRLPAQYTRTQGQRVADVQDSVQVNTTLVRATQDHVAMRFNSAEFANDISIDRLSELHIQPAMKVLVSGIESDYLTAMTKATYNCAGTAGTAITDLSVAGAARAKINQGLAPKSNRSIQMDSITMGSFVNGLRGLLQDAPQIKNQYREGLVGRTAMADYYENERCWTMTNGADVTGTTDAAAGVTDGGTTLSADTAAAVTYTVGQVFTIAGVYACHPETKQVLPYLQQFTNTAGTGSGGDFTISPATYLTGARQNVCSSTGTQLATTDFNSKTLTAVGAASTSYVQSLMYQKEAFAFATAKLPMMAGKDNCSVKVVDGLALRVWKQSDIRNDEWITRIDILYGYSAIRPAWACRMIGSATA